MFQLANGGTLFLDEICDLSLPAQAKVLMALEQGEVMKVGGQAYEKVDLRVVSASNKNIEQLMAERGFRDDLFHRIHVVPIHLSPLRERREDIPLLAKHFLQEACAQNERCPKKLESSAEAVLMAQAWPGNARDLRNIMERLAVLVEGERINGRMVQSVLHLPEPRKKTTETLAEARETFERNYVSACLDENNWNIAKTAQAMDIERTHLYRKMAKLGIKGK